ncbi:DIL domain-containing protein [Chlamydoabsidia padenii]|nr:DIL domain-containing protein [Chlamydoabsidia padenii]
MWATTNNHKVIVEMLLSHGASWTNRTTKGRTVLDFVDYNDQELVHILTPEATGDDIDQKHTFEQEQEDFYQQISIYKRRQRSSTIPKLDLDADTSFYYQPNMPTLGDNNYEQQDLASKRQRSLVESLYTKDDDELDELVSCEASMESLHHFVWNRCLPDQMFVFAEEDIPHILKVTVSSLKLPMKTRQEIWVPSNVLFLCARFAHYYSGRELLAGILGRAISMIATVLHKNKGDIHTTAFWMANLSQLLYYLKKDTGLVVATAEHQLEISELVSETYVLLVTDSEKRIEKILEASMLDHDLIGADPVDFADDWQRFFRRRGSSRRPSSMASVATTATSSTMEQSPSMFQRTQEIYQDDLCSTQQQQQQQQHHSIDLTCQTPTSPMNSLSSFMSSTSITSPSFTTLSPHSITSLLSSILYVLQSYEVHPAIIMQAIAQFFHFMSCEIFNRILTNKKFMCRSKALQIRMNLSIIEDWVREQQPYLPLHLTSYFDPLIQLLQLLQCVSQLNELTTFVGTTTGFELLNPLQIRRCVLNYRYEVDEPRLPDEVEKYTIQLAQNAVNNNGGRISNCQGGNKKRQGGDHNMEISLSRCSTTKSRPSPMHSNPTSRRHSQVSSRPTSVSSLGSLIMSRWTSNSAAEDQQQRSKDNNPDDDEQKRWTDDMELDDDNNDPDNEDQESGRDWIEEKRDSKYMLPFSLPTSTTMIHYSSYQQHQYQQLPLRLDMNHQQADDDDDDDDDDRLAANNKLHELISTESIYQEARQKKGVTEREKKAKERTVIPTIPQDWMDRLDRRQEDSASTLDMDEGELMDGSSSHGARRAMEMC